MQTSTSNGVVKSRPTSSRTSHGRGITQPGTKEYVLAGLVGNSGLSAVDCSEEAIVEIYQAHELGAGGDKIRRKP